jgi:hypothetical protein
VEAGINPHDYRYTEYTLPFNQKNFENLYKQRQTQSTSSVTLVIYTEGASERPRQITNVEEFSKRPFDDLWQEAITPRYRLDRSYADNLEAKSYPVSRTNSIINPAVASCAHASSFY